MSAFLAIMALIALSIGNTVALYWFSYGMWPHAWWPIPVAAIVSACIHAALARVTKEATS